MPKPKGTGYNLLSASECVHRQSPSKKEASEWAARSKRGVRIILPQAMLFFSLIVALQWHSGAFRSGFGGHPDEAAHYVTGLMLREYLCTWPPTSPLKFAENYYLHYPKVAFGHWPPFFYMVQAIWTLLFSPSRVSLLLLSALITTLLSLTIYLVTVGDFGPFPATTCGLLLIALPIIQRHSEMVMADTLLALLMLWATLSFSRFLDSEHWQDAACFGIFSALAILTKGDGLALVLVPPLGLGIMRRWRLMLRFRFWLPLLIVLVLCAPWYFFTRKMFSSGWEKKWLASELVLRLHYYSWVLFAVLGIGIFSFALVGFVAEVIAPLRSRKVQPKWAALAGMLIGAWVVAWFVTSGWEERYLIPALPACLCFASSGISWIAGRLPLPRLAHMKKVAALSVALAIIFAVTKLTLPTKMFFGFGDVAYTIAFKPEFRDSVILVSSDAYGKGEGLFISELAMCERHPVHVVLRASKVLADSSFMGSDYRLPFNTPEEVMRYLDSVPVGIVVFDRAAIPESKEHILLSQTIQDYPQRWQLLASYTTRRNGAEQPAALEIFRVVNSPAKSQESIRVNMHRVLNKDLELTR